VTARSNLLSARTIAAALWDDGDARSDAEMADALGVTAGTLRSYHQQWRRQHGERNNRSLPPEVEVAILEMRNVGGLSFPAIAQVVREDFGYDATAKTIGEYYRRNAGGLPVPVDVDGANLPLETTVGLCWAVKVWPPHKSNNKRNRHSDFCDFCPHRDECLEAGVRHWFVRCERPLEFELEVIR